MERLTNMIPTGEDNAIHLHELAMKLHSAQSSTKNMIRQARQQGLPILSSKKGYWLSDDPKDKERFIAMMEMQALSRFKSTKRMRISLKEVQGQIKAQGRRDGSL